MTATFSADVTLADAQAALRARDQWLPIDGNPSTALGQLVERNSTGPLRLGYGAWRDLLLGAQFHNGRGQLITAGGRTMKNVAGYDLTKFMVGQHGIFGRLVTLTTRTYKLPTHAAIATFTRGSIGENVRRLGELLVTPMRPHWAVVDAEKLLCGYVGNEQAIAFCEQTIRGYESASFRRQSLEQDIDLRMHLLSEPLSHDRSARVAVPPSGIQRFIQAAQPNHWIADAAFGIVWLSCTECNTVRKAARDAGGSVINFTKAGRDEVELSRDQAAQALLQRLKYAFDPDGKLAPLPAP